MTTRLEEKMNELLARGVGFGLVIAAINIQSYGISARICGLVTVLYAIGLIVYGRFDWWKKR